MDTTDFTNEQNEQELKEIQDNEWQATLEDHDLDNASLNRNKKTTYQSEPATENQHKYWVFLCRGLKKLTAPEMGKLEDKFMNKFNIDRWSDINQDQISAAIDFVNRYWNKEGKYNELVRTLIEK